MGSREPLVPDADPVSAALKAFARDVARVLAIKLEKYIHHTLSVIFFAPGRRAFD